MYLYATFFVAQAAMAQHEGFVAPYHVREQAGTSLESRLQSYLEDKELKKNADGGDDFQTLAVTPKSSKAEKQWMAQTFVDDLVMSLGCEDGMQRQIYFDRSKKIISLMGDVGVSIPSLKHYLYTRLKARCAEANEAKDLNTVNYCASQLYENTVMSIDTMFSEYPKRIKAEYGKGFDSGKHIEKWLGVEGKDMTSAYQEQMDRIRTVLRELRGDRNKNSTETPQSHDRDQVRRRKSFGHKAYVSERWLYSA